MALRSVPEIAHCSSPHSLTDSPPAPNTHGAHTRARARARAHTHTQTHAHTWHARTHKHKHAHHTRTRARTHTHKHFSSTPPLPLHHPRPRPLASLHQPTTLGWRGATDSWSGGRHTKQRMMRASRQGAAVSGHVWDDILHPQSTTSMLPGARGADPALRAGQDGPNDEERGRVAEQASPDPQRRCSSRPCAGPKPGSSSSQATDQLAVPSHCAVSDHKQKGA